MELITYRSPTLPQQVQVPYTPPTSTGPLHSPNKYRSPMPPQQVQVPYTPPTSTGPLHSPNKYRSPTLPQQVQVPYTTPTSTGPLHHPNKLCPDKGRITKTLSSSSFPARSRRTEEHDTAPSACSSVPAKTKLSPKHLCRNTLIQSPADTDPNWRCCI